MEILSAAKILGLFLIVVALQGAFHKYAGAV